MKPGVGPTPPLPRVTWPGTSHSKKSGRTPHGSRELPPSNYAVLRSEAHAHQNFSPRETRNGVRKPEELEKTRKRQRKPEEVEKTGGAF